MSWRERKSHGSTCQTELCMTLANNLGLAWAAAALIPQEAWTLSNSKHLPQHSSGQLQPATLTIGTKLIPETFGVRRTEPQRKVCYVCL